MKRRLISLGLALFYAVPAGLLIWSLPQCMTSFTPGPRPRPPAPALILGTCIPSGQGTCTACADCSQCHWCNRSPDHHCSVCAAAACFSK